MVATTANAANKTPAMPMTTATHDDKEDCTAAMAVSNPDILPSCSERASLTEIKRWTDQIDDLLEKHLIALPEHDTIMLINLNGDHGAVCYFLG
jgi:hypothetical protein